jgi:uncharacterized membrane protein HdeD (DUF308 family)
VYVNPLSPRRGYDRETAQLVAQTWWAGLLGGIISVVFGAVILSVDWSVSSLALVLGILLVLRGLATASARPSDGGDRRFNVVLGTLEAGAGIAIAVWPEPGLLTLAVLIGIRLLVGGVVMTVGALANRELPHWWLVLLLGLIQLPLGVWALRRPGMTLAILITLVGVWAIAAGIVEAALALELRKRGRRAAAPEPG